MTYDELQTAVPEGEALRFTNTLRTDEHIGLTDARMLIVTDEVTSIEYDRIEEVTFQSIDWFLVVSSVLLVGFGVYATQMNVLGGLVFVLFGLASLYRTYGKRGEMLVQVRGRAKPLRLYPDDLPEFQRAVEKAIERRQAIVDEAVEDLDETGESTH